MTTRLFFSCKSKVWFMETGSQSMEVFLVRGYTEMGFGQRCCFMFKMRLLFSRSVMSESLQPPGLQHAGLPCQSPTPRVQTCVHWVGDDIQPFCSRSSPSPVLNLSQHPFLMSQFFASGGQSIGASASVLLMNTQSWFPLGLTGLTSLQSKGLSRVFSNTTVQKYQFFSAQPSLWSNFHIHTWLLEKP